MAGTQGLRSPVHVHTIPNLTELARYHPYCVSYGQHSSPSHLDICV